jgi:rubrerythrin
VEHKLTKDSKKNVSRQERIRRVTDELKQKNKDVIERRRREGFGIPDHERTDEQRKIQKDKEKERFPVLIDDAKKSWIVEKIDNWSENQYRELQELEERNRRDIRCPSCNSNVSKSAYTCPACGHPIRFGATRAGVGCLGWSIVFIAIPMFLFILLFGLG